MLDEEDDSPEEGPHQAPPQEQPTQQDAVIHRIQKRPKAQSKRPAKRSRRTKSRGVGYTTQEINHLLDCIGHVVPVGPIEWDEVTQMHLDAFTECGRHKNSLRRKFSKLAHHKIPTGDPNCPPEVRYAKRIYREIEEKMDSVEEIDDAELGFPVELVEPNVVGPVPPVAALPPAAAVPPAAVVPPAAAVPPPLQ